MSDKIKLPKEVCQALDSAKEDYRDYEIIKKITDSSWGYYAHVILNTQDADLIMRALVLGYEPVTPEEIIKDLILHPNYALEDSGIDTIEAAYRQGIYDTLRIYEIHHPWLDKRL